MRRMHIAFCLDQAYGHIYPTLGLAAELARRGHKVSYSAPLSFSLPIERNGAHVMPLEPLPIRSLLYPAALRKDGSYDFSSANERFVQLRAEIQQRKTEDSLCQLKMLFAKDRPDLVVYDNAHDLSGELLAQQWSLKKALLAPAILGEHHLPHLSRHELVLVTVPRFLCDVGKVHVDRIHFLGYIPEGGRPIRWKNPWHPHKVTLVSPTTGLLPQMQFCELAVRAFEGSSLLLVLSAAAKSDPVSSIDDNQIPELPDNFRLNDGAPHVTILEHARLFIGQGGLRSTLEALYCGVPALLIPPSLAHESIASRVAELGFAKLIKYADATPQRLREAAMSAMLDEGLLQRVRDASVEMHAENGASLGADAIERYTA